MTIDAAALAAIIPAGAAHRRQAFVIYAQVAGVIEAGSIASLAEVAAAFAG